YQKVRYASIYKGIDLVYGGPSGVMKSEYLVAPGADPSQIRFQFEDAERISVSEGALVVHGHGAEFRECSPDTYQEGRHGREPVHASYRIFDDGSVGFNVANYDNTRPLIIDPEVSFSTFWGGSQFDALTGVAVGTDGSIYVCGWAESIDVPTV